MLNPKKEILEVTRPSLEHEFVEGFMEGKEKNKGKHKIMN